MFEKPIQGVCMGIVVLESAVFLHTGTFVTGIRGFVQPCDDCCCVGERRGAFWAGHQGDSEEEAAKGGRRNDTGLLKY